MPINIYAGDIFESKAQTLTNPVNTVGVMGKGLASEFKRRYPEMFRDYEFRCKTGKFSMSHPYVYESHKHQWILNFPTKTNWRDRTADLNGIIGGLNTLSRTYKNLGITSLAMPMLGCAEGGLDWIKMGGYIIDYLSDIPIPIELYLPFGTAPRTHVEINWCDIRIHGRMLLGDPRYVRKLSS